MSKHNLPSMLLAGALVLLTLSSVCQSAEVPESLLPPMVRPVGRINLQMPVQNPYQQRFYNGNNNASAVFSLDGKYMASMDVQAALQLYDAGTGKILRQINHNTMLNCLVFSPDGKTLLGTQADNMGMGVHLFDVASGKHLRQLDEGANEINISAVAWSPDGTKLALAGVNQQRNTGPIITLWDAASGDEIRKITGLPGAAAAAGPGAMNPWMMRRQQQNGPLECIAFAPDGKSLAVVIDRTIHLIELATGKVRGQAGTLPNAKQQFDDETIQMMRMQGMRGWQQGGMTGASCIAFSPDGKTVVSGGPTIRLWDPATGREVRPLAGHLGAVNALAISPDGRLVASTSEDNTIRFWDRATGREQRVGEGKTGLSGSVEFTPDGRTAITAGNDRIIRIWDAHTGAELRQLAGHKGPVLSVSVSPGGTMLASAGGWHPFQDKNDADYAIRLWDMKTGKEVRRFGDHTEMVISVSWSPTGKVIASSSADGTVRLWDATTGEEVRRFDHQKNSYCWLAFSPDGKLLASPEMAGIVVWDTASGREHCRLKVTSAPTTAAFSPDGSVLAVADGYPNHQIRLLETRSHLEIAAFPAEGNHVSALRFSRDGRFLVSGGSDGTLLVWDATRQEKLRQAPAVAWTAAYRARLWQDLGSPDAGKADRVGWTLALAAQPLLPWLKEQVQPVPLLKPEQLKQWIADLNGEQQATREEAGQQLEALGQTAEPFLQRALEASRSADLSVQLKELLSRAQGPPVYPGTLQKLRAATVLERMDRPEATAVVEKLAQGQPGARITLAAQAVLERRRLRQVVDAPPVSSGETAEAQPPAIPRGPERRDAQGDLLPPGALLRLGTARWHPTDGVVCLRYSPNGNVLVSAGRYVWIWDANTGRELHRFGYAPTGVSEIAISPNSELLAHVDEDGTIHLRELLTGKEIRSFKRAGEGAHALSFSPDGKVLATSGDAKGVQLWDAATGKEIRRLAGPGTANATVAFSPAGNILATAGRDGIVSLRDPSDGKEIKRFAGFQGPAVFSPDGKLLALRSAKNMIHVMDAASGQALRQIEPGELHFDFYSDLAFSPDSKLLATGSGLHPRTVSVWEVASGQQKLAIRGHNGKNITAVAFSPDGKVLATAGDDHVIRRWDLATGKELASADDRQAAINDMVFARNGKTIITGRDNGTVRQWDAATGQELSHFQTLMPPQVWFPVLVLSPDGALAASTKRANARSTAVSVWNVPTGEEVRVLEVPDTISICRLALSADGKKLVTLGMRGEIGTWDLTDGRSLGSINTNARGMLLSPDGHVLATSGNPPQEEIRLWHVPTGNQLQRMPGGHLFAPSPTAFSPDGNCLAASGEHVHYYEVPTGKERCQFRGQGCAAIAPNGQLLACGRDDDDISLYALTTGKEIARFTGHRGWLTRLAFSPDSTRLASASSDCTVLVWDIAAVADRARPVPVTLTDTHLANLWTDLADADASRAYRARVRLLAAPRQAIRYFESRLAPVDRAEARVAQLIRDLDSDEFALRERATENLAGLGDLVKPALRKLLEGKPNLEVRRRTEPLLAAREVLTSPEKVRSWRAIELLEHVGTPEARALLANLATGAPEALLTRMAQAAVARLK